MKVRKYNIHKVKEASSLLGKSNQWKETPKISIENYLWLNNNYKPRVEVKLCYSNSNLHIYFKAFEDEITARYTQINDPVHKDSCVEFFVNLFPNKTDEYFNFEMNPLGTIHVGFGAVGNRLRLTDEDIQLIEISSTLNKPIVGKYGRDYWEVYYKIPISLFDKHYKMKFIGEDAKANFYKCGDDSKYEHYGVWNNVDSPKLNFHQPEYFGDLVFDN